MAAGLTHEDASAIHLPSAQPRRSRGVLLLACFLPLYAASFFIIGQSFRPGTGMLAVVPALIAGWYAGARAGAVCGGLAVVLNWTMNTLALPPEMAVGWTAYLLGAAVIAFLGAMMGRFSETTQARSRELEERTRIAEQLELSRTELEQRVADRTLELAAANAALRSEIEERERLLEDRLRLEQQLHQAQKMEAVGTLAGGVAHDFNNLLTAIIGFAGVARMRTGVQQQNAIEQIDQAASRAAELTRSLLTFARRQPVKSSVIDVNVIVRACQRLLQQLLGEDIALELSLTEGVFYVRIDPAQLEQVLVNLVVNGRHAMPQGGQLRVATENVVRGGAQLMRLTVEDTGQGMCEATLPRIFEPFFTTREPGSGTGLGLATSYGIVTHSGGTISATSTLGQGTCFEVLLPRCDAPLSSETPSLLPEPARGTETVLVVEDDAQVRMLMQMEFTSRGYHVLVAETPERALALGQASRPIDLLISDVVMPGRSGPEVAATLRLGHPQMAVLFVSGYAPDTLEKRGLPMQEAAFLPKPFTVDVLVARARQLLDLS